MLPVRSLALALILLLLCPLAAAQDSLLVYDSIQLPRDSQVLDLGQRRVVDLARLRGYLDQLPALERVVMPRTRLSVAQLEELQAAYPGIRFETTFGFVKGAVSTTQTAYSTLNRLSDKRYPESRFEALRHCPDLKALDLGHNLIADLGFLRALPGLRVLILADNHIEDLGPLADLEELEYLELFMNRITDLTPLAGLVHLKDLNLTRNRISDISPLLGLAALERLWIPDNFLTGEQKAQLEAALPNCRIVYEWSRSTSHGWREHPRYEVIKRVFRSGVYEPFPQAP